MRLSLHSFLRQSRSLWTSAGSSQQVYRIAEHEANLQATGSESWLPASSEAHLIKALQAGDASACTGCASSNVHAFPLLHAADQVACAQSGCTPQVVTFDQAGLNDFQHSFAFSANGSRTDPSIPETPKPFRAGYTDDVSQPTSSHQQITPVRAPLSGTLVSKHIKPWLSHAHDRSLHTSVSTSDTTVHQASITQRYTSNSQNATPSPAYKSVRSLPLGPAKSLPLQQSASNLQVAATKVLAVFGHTAFRGVQLPAIMSILKGGDALALMTTGGGKSLIYQVGKRTVIVIAARL